MNLLDPLFAKRQRILLPWEQPGNQFLSDVFNTASSSSGTTLLDPEWNPKFLAKVHESIKEQEVTEIAKVQSDMFLKSVFSSTEAQLSSRRIIFARPQEGDKAVAIEKWKLIIGVNPSASVVGRQILQCSASQDPAGKTEMVLQDTFRSKAQATLDSRSGSFLKFIRWAIVSVPDPDNLGNQRIYPISESVCYDYICFLRSEKAPPTSATKFKEAVAFCYGVIGLDGADECLGSRRMQGAALQALSLKELDRSMDDFLVEHVRLFETCASQLPTGVDKVFSGFAAALVHFRARMSDTFKCVCEPFLDLDANGNGFVQVDVFETKTGRTAGRMRKRLPLVGSANGICKTSWAQHWLRARHELSLDSTGSFLMPGISSKGLFTQNKMTTSEFTVRVRELILSKGSCIPASMKVGSHSCKKTGLGWASKAGIKIGIRRLLGYHIKSSEGSAIVYSRDAMAGPLREFFAVLEAIHSGRFKPDETRSGRWEEPGEVIISDDIENHDVPLGDSPSEDSDGFQVVLYKCGSCNTRFKNGDRLVSCTQCQEFGCDLCLPTLENEGVVTCFSCFHRVADEKAAEENVSSSEGSPSESDDSSDNSSDPEGETAAEIVATNLHDGRDKVEDTFKLGKKAAGGMDDGLVQNNRLKTIHLCKDFSSSVLSCGRPCGEDTHSQLLSLPSFQFPKCRDCFGTIVAE